MGLTLLADGPPILVQEGPAYEWGSADFEVGVVVPLDCLLAAFANPWKRFSHYLNLITDNDGTKVWSRVEWVCPQRVPLLFVSFRGTGGGVKVDNRRANTYVPEGITNDMSAYGR